jgi:hypothetical protein
VNVYGLLSACWQEAFWNHRLPPSWRGYNNNNAELQRLCCFVYEQQKRSIQVRVYILCCLCDPFLAWRKAGLPADKSPQELDWGFDPLLLWQCIYTAMLTPLTPNPAKIKHSIPQSYRKFTTRFCRRRSSAKCRSSSFYRVCRSAMARSTLEDFLLKEKIGTGSYGAVYRATRKVDRYGGKLQTCCCPASMPVPGACRPQQWPPVRYNTLKHYYLLQEHLCPQRSGPSGHEQKGADLRCHHHQDVLFIKLLRQNQH